MEAKTSATEEQKPRFREFNKAISEKTEKKIAKIYDGTGKKFILHLIGAFLPIDHWSKMMGFKEGENPVCCLTNQKLAGIMDMAKMDGKGMDLLLLRCKIQINQDEEEREEQIKKYNELLSTVPEEISKRNIAYCSDTSDKFLSEEALVALQNFAINRMLRGDKDIEFAVNKKRIKHFHGSKLSKGEVNKAAKAITHGTTLGDLPALQSIAAKMKEEEGNKN